MIEQCYNTTRPGEHGAGPKMSSEKNSGSSLKYNFDHDANPYNKRSVVYGSSKHKETKAS